ncbi:hypothetical protein RUM44_005283 [Polyplax serrata]|uniref:Octanoyl-[acyl-carrier-protein]:protein N-octanoyltransferase LIPT2, mitochondrial n=1 Tax=Polyplax serrata TaxID=468196 RepID=A0ABR1AEK5_POLSC
MSKVVQVLSVGCLSYGHSLQLQKTISIKVKKKEIPDTLIIVEHKPVYTVGIRDKSYGADEEKKLRTLGAEFYRTNRGGLITFHGPGQMVVYPILDLRNYKPSVRWYVHNLENTIIDLCAHYNIKAYTSPHTGVWVNDCKICALGIHAGQYITTHGLALNCNIDLSWFKHIVPCGIEGKFVTSLSEQLNQDIEIKTVVPNFLKMFSKLFDCQIYDIQEGSDALQNILNNTV